MKASRTILRITGIVLFVVLVVWIGYVFVGVGAFDQVVLPFETAVFNTQLSLSPESVAVVDSAKEAMASENQAYRWWRLAAQIVTWTGFICTALITLITGARGKPESDDAAAPAGDNPSESPNGDKITRRFYGLGFLGALASVCTLFVAQASPNATTHLSNAEDIQTEIQTFYAAVRQSPDREDELRLELEGVVERF